MRFNNNVERSATLTVKRIAGTKKKHDASHSRSLYCLTSFCLVNTWSLANNAVPVPPTCEMLVVSDLSCVASYADIECKSVTADGPIAV